MLVEVKTSVLAALAWASAALAWSAGVPTQAFAPGYLTIIMLALMSVELLTAYRASPRSGDRYPWGGKIVSKLMLVAMVVVALLLDGVVFTLVHHMGSDEGSPSWLLWDSGPWAKGVPIVAIGSIIWVCTAEAIKVIDHVAHTEGPGAIPPVVLWVLRQIRRTDLARFRATHEEGTPTPKRWIDDLTEEDIIELLERREARNVGRLDHLVDKPPPEDEE